MWAYKQISKLSNENCINEEDQDASDKNHGWKRSKKREAYLEHLVDISGTRLDAAAAAAAA
jgi:hypothetical protein